MTSILDSATWDLVALGLVHPSDIVDGELRLSSAASRNRALWLERGTGPPLLVKRPEPGVPATRRTVAREAHFYSFCFDEPSAASIAAFLPPAQPLSDTGGETLLVAERLEGSRSLWRYLAEVGLTAATAGACEALGRALATLHADLRHPGPADDPRLGELPHGPPEPLFYDLPEPRMLRFLSPANLGICRALQADPRSLEAYEKSRQMWRDEALIHGDIRSDNLLVVESGGDGSVEIRLIDWEFLQIGDPAWDLGDVMRDFTNLWIFGMSWAPHLEAGERVDSAAASLDELRPALAAFWRSYLESRGLPLAGSRELLLRAVLYSGIRLVQTAWEYSANAEELSSRDVLLLQVATNVLADPERAARELFELESSA